MDASALPDAAAHHPATPRAPLSARMLAAVVALTALLAAAPTGPGATFPDTVPEWVQQGRVSSYGPGFHGRRTASGEVFDTTDLTLAHRTLDFGSEVRVTNLRSGRSVVVRVNDRGPHVRGRIADASVAGLLLTTDVMLAAAPKEEEYRHGMPDMGGMGDMGT